MFASKTKARIVDGLRIRGEYRSWFARMQEKQRVLEAAGLDAPIPEDVGIEDTELWRWYFEEGLGCAIPSDLSDYLQATGWDDVTAFRIGVLREYCYRRIAKK